MEETELKSIIAQEIANSLGLVGSTLSDERMRLLQYYEGMLPQGNGIPDRSQLTDRTVMSVIHWLLPDLVRVFMSTDKIISFEARRPQDTKLAMQISDYVAFILREDNEGFKIIYEWIKSAICLKNGFLKVSYEPQTQISMNSFTGLTDQELAMLMSELDDAEKYEIIDQKDYPDPSRIPQFGSLPPQMQQMPMPQSGPPGQGMPPMPPGGPPPGMNGQSPPPGMMPPPPPPAPMLHDIRCRIYDTEGRVVIRNVLPEQILISPRCPSTKFDGSYFIGHRVLTNVTECRMMGYPDDLIDQARGDESMEFNEERMIRFLRDGDDNPPGARTDEAMQPIELVECYLKVDWNDDGLAELRKVVAAQDGSIIFSNEEIDEVPIINLTPIIEPGRAIGTSISELVVPLQETKSALIRGVMDSLYLSLIPRNMVNINKLTEDTFDDLNDGGSPGCSIRINDDGAIVPFITPFIGKEALGVLEYIDQEIQTTTGVGPQNNIISPDVLNNQTAAGISMQQNAASGQIELICRVMAETGFRELARHILGLVVRHQDKPRMIRLNGEFTEVDPRYWHENFEISVTVGLGTGNKEKTTRDLMGILQIMQPVFQLVQKGMEGPYVTASDLHQVTSKLTEAMGYKEDFFPHLVNPAQPPGGQQPDPEIQKQQQQAQIEQQKGQMQMQVMQQKAQLESQLAKEKHDNEIQMEQARHVAEMQREKERAQNQMEIEVMREQSKQRLQQQQLAAQIAMDVTP